MVYVLNVFNFLICDVTDKRVRSNTSFSVNKQVDLGHKHVRKKVTCYFEQVLKLLKFDPWVLKVHKQHICGASCLQSDFD